jgi:methionine synthase II (cobalamin-independent)
MTTEEVQAELDAVKGDKTLSAQDRKNVIRRLTRKLEKAQVQEVQTQAAKVVKAPPRKDANPEAAMDDIVQALGTLLPRTEDRVLFEVPGMTYSQVNILEAQAQLKADAVTMAGTLVKHFSGKWAKAPEWYTTFQSGTQVMVALGPVPQTNDF